MQIFIFFYLNSILERVNIVSDFYIFESDNKYKVQWVPLIVKQPIYRYPSILL